VSAFTCKSVVKRRHNGTGRVADDKLMASGTFVPFQSFSFFFTVKTHPAIKDSTSIKVKDKIGALKIIFQRCLI